MENYSGTSRFLFFFDESWLSPKHENASGRTVSFFDFCVSVRVISCAWVEETRNAEETQVIRDNL